VVITNFEKILESRKSLLIMNILSEEHDKHLKFCGFWCLSDCNMAVIEVTFDRDSLQNQRSWRNANDFW